MLACKGTNKQFSDNHQRRFILALVYHNVLFLCISFRFHLYMIENIPFEKGGNLSFLYTNILNTFFLPVGRHYPAVR